LTVWQLGLEAFAVLREQESELAQLEEMMADSSRAEEAMARYGPLQEDFERAGGYIYPARIRRVLNGLGFKPAQYDHSLTQLSGGERTRAFLARLLLENPALLILDEPTNHLDIESIQWLEGWLNDWCGTAIIVSHDRYFLDRTAQIIWELSLRGMATYRGNYTAYVRQREEKQRFQLKEYEAQQDFIQRERDYIRRNIAGQNTRQAQGRRKRLERMLKDQAIDRPQQGRSVRIEFEEMDRSGDRVIETHQLAIGYQDAAEPLFRVPDLVLTRAECVALIGPNGAGKTTFLKTLMGEISPLSGSVQWGANIKIGYFAQAHEGLRPDNTVLEELLSAAPGIRISQARDFLAKYLFTGHDVEKQVGALSGGERGRLALAKLALEGANFLLLDEPTNHLDIPSQEVLQDALEGFPGTILLVSHDRYLVNALATQIWVIREHDGEMGVYQGGYAAYLEANQNEEEDRKLSKKKFFEARVRIQGNSQRRKELEALEDRINGLESEFRAVSEQIEGAGVDVEKVRELGERYAILEAELNREMETWERIASELMGA
jgi:ATP-binding cassette subfamily F protein 3